MDSFRQDQKVVYLPQLRLIGCDSTGHSFFEVPYSSLVPWVVQINLAAYATKMYNPSEMSRAKAEEILYSQFGHNARYLFVDIVRKVPGNVELKVFFCATFYIREGYNNGT